MKLKLSLIKNHYYKRILLFMIFFSFIILIPFSFISYEISKKNIINSINFSNNSVLSQMNYNYSYFSKNISNICMELFLNNDIQQILYSKDLSYNEVFYDIKQISDTTLLTNPSIDSIVIYNHKRDEWFTTKPNENSIGQQLENFVKTQPTIPKLQPVLRKVTNKDALDSTTYVFTYFMYQFSDPAIAPNSYIAINQNANWFIDNIANIKQTDSLSNAIYLLDSEGKVCNNTTNAVLEPYQYLIDDYWKNYAGTESEHSKYYTRSYNKDSFLITSIKLGNQENSLLMIQKFSDVFQDLITLRNDFILLACIFGIATIIMLFLVSNKIYLPVKLLVSNLSKAVTKNTISNSENEFEYLRNIYQNANEINQKLMKQSESYVPMIENYQLYYLTIDSSMIGIEKFKKMVNTHWLLSSPIGGISVVLCKIDNFKNNVYHFEENDLNLLLYAVQNIVEELFAKEYEFSSFYYKLDTIALIVHLPKDADSDQLIPLIERCQIAIKKSLDITLSVAYSGVGDSLVELSSLCTETKDHLQYRYLFGPGSILNKSKCLLNYNNELVQYPYELDEKLTEHLKQKQVDQAIVVIEDIKNILYTFRYNHITVCIMTLISKINITLSELNESGQLTTAVKYNDIYKKAVELDFMEDLFQDIYSYIKATLSDSEQVKLKDKEEGSISTIIDFIQNNYNDANLSSQTVGDYLGLSNRYIMRKFKENTGSTLTEYIISVRMRKAASLLQNTNLPINKIAEHIGIENIPYFYHLFKKTYHCTPREFSEKYKQSAALL